MMYLVAAIGCAAVILLLVVVFVLSRRRTLSRAAKKKINDLWAGLEHHEDHGRRVLEADSILDLALTELGYTGSLGDKLKQAGPRFRDENAVWSAHKFRNKIAHEPGLQVSDQEATRALKALRRAVDDLC